MLQSMRAEFALKDPSALSALLSYDWRQRELLTDAELFGDGRRKGAIEAEDGLSLVRPLQRQGFIKPLHGVRPDAAVDATGRHAHPDRCRSSRAV